ncbi:hypothetical protein ACHQM5_014057 [Ranunculus cassubicifolius]
MSRLNIEKKLLPAKKAWKSFKSSIQKKLHKLKKSKAIKKTTKHLNTVLRRKNKTLRRPSSNLRFHRKTPHYRPSYAPVYVHDLFMQPPVVQMMTTNNKVDKKGKVAAHIDPGSSKMVTEFSEEGNKRDRPKPKILEIKWRQSQKFEFQLLQQLPHLQGIQARQDKLIMVSDC